MTTGKQKAARVPVDYLKRAGGLKWWLTGVAAVVTVLALAALVVGGRWKAAASPGPLSRAHAAFDNDCGVCHAPFSPVAGENPLAHASGGTHPSDALCRGCHSGSPHHPGREIAEQVGSCASCHHEHRGRDASLTNLRDDACTACHARLTDHVVGGKTDYVATIRGFTLDHPEFRLVKEDTSRAPGGKPVNPEHLKFNHQVHLSAGLKHAPTDARAWTLANVSDKEARERYRRGQPENRRDDSDAVQLSCASCHEPDGGSTPTAGAYMPPVRYDRHCQGCHPLTLGAELPGVTLPHHLQAKDVHRILWGAFIEKAAGEARADAAPPASPLPGHGLNPAEEKARARVEAQAKGAEDFLRLEDVKKLEEYVYRGKTACGLCHEFKAEGGGPPQVVPVGVPEVWFKHAWFDHRSHRAVDCQECHAGAAASTTNTDLLLPDIAVCRRCHAPRGVDGNQPVGGVRDNCTTCHAYHDEDAAVRGRADAARGAPRPGTINEFLSGHLRQP
jgi:hypothetical protein